MAQTKKKQIPLFAFPRITQKIFIIVGLLAYLANALYWSLLWARVYPTGGRLSPFAVMAANEVTLPVLVFIIVYMLHKNQPTRLGRVFIASLLTFMATLIQIAFWSLYHWATSMPSILNEFFASYWPMVSVAIIVLITMTFLALYARLRPKQSSIWRLRRIFLTLAAITFVISATYILPDIATRLQRGDAFLSVVMQMQVLTQFILPIVFFCIAYTTFKSQQKGSRVYSAAIYTAIGVIISTFFTSITMLSMQVAKQEWLWSVYDIAAPCLALVVFLVLIIASRRSVK